MNHRQLNPNHRFGENRFSGKIHYASGSMNKEKLEDIKDNEEEITRTEKEKK